MCGAQRGWRVNVTSSSPLSLTSRVQYDWLITSVDYIFAVFQLNWQYEFSTVQVSFFFLFLYFSIANTSQLYLNLRFNIFFSLSLSSYTFILYFMFAVFLFLFSFYLILIGIHNRLQLFQVCVVFRLIRLFSFLKWTMLNCELLNASRYIPTIADCVWKWICNDIKREREKT